MKEHRVQSIENRESRGMTLIEILIVMAIAVAIVLIVSIFQSSLQIQQNARKILRPLAEEIRSATISNIGAFPISMASSTQISFYSDIDNDGLKEKVRYFLENDEFKKGIITPKGDPFVYDPEDEEIIGVVGGVVNGEEPIFQYFDDSYNGTSSTTPLSYPIDVTDITLVKTKLIIDLEPDKDPGPVEISTQAMFRNLKDN
jgi:prepilin-type N-terminal cleavage/methylation domain-containing protein